MFPIFSLQGRENFERQNARLMDEARALRNQPSSASRTSNSHRGTVQQNRIDFPREAARRGFRDPRNEHAREVNRLEYPRPRAATNYDQPSTNTRVARQFAQEENQRLWQ